jgi:glyoxylase-like metal-dependent hydrolase (beta-lactamase superfamily II)
MSQKIDPRIVEVSAKFYDFTFVYLYLVRGEKNILIDTGIHSSPERDILPVLKPHGLTLSDIDLILNTHDHPDHTGGNAAVKAASGAQIYIHKDEVPFLNDHEHAFEFYTAPVIRAMGGNLQAAKQASLEMAGPVVASDRQLEGGDIIDGGPGVKLRVVYLPGHTLGSVGFFWEEEGILFSGDSVGGLHDAGAGGKLPIVFDLMAYKKSLQRLQEMPIRSLLCAHRYRALHLPPAPVRQGPEVSQFVKDSLEFTERLDEAIQKVSSHSFEKSFMQLADEVVAQFPKEMGFKPLTQVERPHLSAQTIYFCLSQIGQKVS